MMTSSTDEPRAHIARAVLPWRKPSDNDTECGKSITEFARVITWDDAVALVKKHGRQRAVFLLCMTCIETTQRYGHRAPTGQCTFEGEPTERLGREFGKRREQTDRELRAMGELVMRHREEFDDLLSGAMVPITELRRQQVQRRRQRYDR